MYSLRVRDVMEKRRNVVGAPGITVAKAARVMSKKNVGALLVVEGERLIGIFTERDALFRVIARGRDPETTTVGEVMTPEPWTIAPTQSFGHALAFMQQHGFRHLPVVQDGRLLGMASARMALDPDLEEFRAETGRRLALR